MFRRFASYFSLLLLLLLVPCLAYAQDETILSQDDAAPSFEEKFGGWYIDLDVQGGAGFYPGGELMEGYGSEHRQYIKEHGSDIGLIEYILKHENKIKGGGLIKLDAGYLFGAGERFFIGPEITVSTVIGYEFHRVANLDARARFVVPIVGGNAIDFAVGVGWMMADMDLAISRLHNGVYLPMQLGYNYTFDNGLMIGCSFEFRLELTYDSILRGDEYEDGDLLAMPGWMGGGVHIGYRFGHHE